MLVYAMIGIVVALALAGAGLGTLFKRHLERRISQELDSHISLLAGNLRIGVDGALFIQNEPGDAAFSKLYSGRYWQVRDESTEALLRSGSLWDSALELPADKPAPGELHEHHVAGPDGADLLLREAVFVITSGGQDRAARIAAAITTEESRELTAGFARDMVPGLGLFALVLLAGAWLQVGAGLAPFDRLRSGIKAIREGQSKRLENPAAAEVQPLVDEVNSLLQQQRLDMQRARDRAADLAHGLKTPLTALAADVTALRAKGEHELAASVEELAAQMARTVERELARARLRSTTPDTAVNLAKSAEAIIRTILRTPQASGIAFEVTGLKSIAAVANPDDVNDILGNLIENAARHASSRVVVGIFGEWEKAVVAVRDDGPGADPEVMQALVQRGTRDDTKGGSAGLGLAIVSDILAAYSSTPEFALAPEGGLSVTVRLPLAVTPGSR